MTSTLLWALALMLVAHLGVAGVAAQSPAKRVMPKNLNMEEDCRNFTVGNQLKKEFYSPRYGAGELDHYPSDTVCFRIITADIGYFVRIDFRDSFHLEPEDNLGNCEYDYLEIRDGDQGYSPLIGKYCNNRFPPIITSSGRSLWMRFSSDSNVEYKGFKAVYSFIENRMNLIPDLPPCVFKVDGNQNYIGTANISDERIQHAQDYDVPIDCVWEINAGVGSQVYLQFKEYDLKHPNDCHLNYIQIFDGKTNMEHLTIKFCGSMADAKTSKNDSMYIRFYAEKSGLESKFRALYTILRNLEKSETKVCDLETEYDCEDTTCISKDLMCNGERNCKFGWDEEDERCGMESAAALLDFSSSHVIIIVIVLFFIMFSMCAGFIWNFNRKIKEDREIIQAAKEARSLANSLEGGIDGGVGAPPMGGGGLAGMPLPPQPGTPGSTGKGTRSVSSRMANRPPIANPEPLPAAPPPPSGANPVARAKSGASHHTSDSNGDCYVPDGGFPLPNRI